MASAESILPRFINLFLCRGSCEVIIVPPCEWKCTLHVLASAYVQRRLMYKILNFCIAIKYCFFNYKIINRPIVCYIPNVAWLSFPKLNLRHSQEINIWNLYNPVHSADQTGIVSRKTLRLQYIAVEDGVRRGQISIINYMGWLGDGIVSVETGNVLETRLDRPPWIHDSQTIS